MFFARVRDERKPSSARRVAPIQARLTIGPAHDPLEQEADRIADRVTQELWSGGLQTPTTAQPGSVVRASHAAPGARDAMTPDEATEQRVQGALRSGGQPLPEQLRAGFESRFGHDFSRVRIHSDAEAAASIGAHAFTHGEDIVFGQGQYQPSTRQGLHLLAHELTHVVQQGGQTLGVQRQDAAAAPVPAADAPAAAETEPTISYGENAVQADVTAYSLGVLKDVLKAAQITSCSISSTSRDPTNQARVMYDNLETYGVEHQKNLYASAGDQVIDVYVAEKKKEGSTPETIKAAMVVKINELGPTKVSRHASDPTVLNVFDVGPKSIPEDKHAALETAALAEKRVSKFLKPPEDPGFHFEIPQS